MFCKRRTNATILSLLAGVFLLMTGLTAQPAIAGNVHPGAFNSAANAGTPACRPLTRFDRNRFPAHPKVNNTWYPLRPGTQFVFEGRSNRGGGPLPHRVVFTVTDVTKVINGVRTVVLWDRDINEGQLSEEELAFQAQDLDGNVWNMAEYPEEYEDGEFIGAPSAWVSGMAGARAGIAMPAAQQSLTRSYQQGHSLEIEFWDCAQLFKTEQQVCIGRNCYDHVLITDEWSPLDPGSGHQRKFYAPNVGSIQVGAVNDPEGETLQLTKIRQLTPRARTAICERVLRLDHRAYQVSEAIYRRTPPAEGPCAVTFAANPGGIGSPGALDTAFEEEIVTK